MMMMRKAIVSASVSNNNQRPTVLYLYESLEWIGKECKTELKGILSHMKDTLRIRPADEDDLSSLYLVLGQVYLLSFVEFTTTILYNYYYWETLQSRLIYAGLTFTE